MNVQGVRTGRPWKRVAAAGAAVVVVLAAVLVGPWLVKSRAASGQDKPQAETATAGPVKRAPVATTPVSKRLFQRQVVVQGSVEAKNTAMVSPRMDVPIEAIFVDEGDAVVAGETKLFRLDSVRFEQALQIAEHDTAVAQCAHREAVAGMERARADLEKAKLDFGRFERLVAKDAVTADAFEQQQSRFRQTEAMYNLSLAQVDLASARQRQAEAAFAIAQKSLADTVSVAPISGKVSARMAEPGEMGQPGAPVVRIEDPSVVEICAFLPAEHYGAITAGRTMMKIAVAGADIGEHAITYKSPTINPKLRTFEIKALIKDPPAGAVPGAISQIAVVLEGREGVGVPTAAIVPRGGRSVVFAVREGMARVVEVETGLETEGWTELRAGPLAEGAEVVTRGQYMLDDGTAVTVQREGR